MRNKFKIASMKLSKWHGTSSIGNEMSKKTDEVQLSVWSLFTFNRLLHDHLHAVSQLERLVCRFAGISFELLAVFLVLTVRWDLSTPATLRIFRTLCLDSGGIEWHLMNEKTWDWSSWWCSACKGFRESSCKWTSGRWLRQALKHFFVTSLETINFLSGHQPFIFVAGCSENYIIEGLSKKVGEHFAFSKNFFVLIQHVWN